MNTVQNIYRLADLANLVKKVRDFNLYTENFEIPTKDAELNNLILSILRDYVENTLPMCEIMDDGLRLKILIPSDIIEKLLFLENAIYVHHYTSPSLATYLSEFTYLVTGLESTDNVHIDINKDINNMYRTSGSNFAKSLTGLGTLSEFLASFYDRFNEHEDNINQFIQNSLERKRKLQALQNQVANRKQQSTSIFKAQADKNKLNLQSKIEQQQRLVINGVEVHPDLPVGTKVRVIRIPTENIWVLYPPAPSVLPPDTVLVSDDDTITKVTCNKTSIIYLTKSNNICEYNDKYWQQGLNSMTADKLYYNPEDGAFYIITSDNKKIFFNDYQLACDFVLQSGISVDVSEVHIHDAGTIKGDE